MDQSGDRHMGILPTRIGHVVRRAPSLLDPRNHLSPDRIVWIVPWDQVKEMRRDREREFIAGKQNTGPFLFAQRQILLQLRQRRYAIFKLPFPVVPKFGANPGPIARRVGAERLLLLNSLGKIYHFRIPRKNLTSLTIVSMNPVLPALGMDSSDAGPARLFNFPIGRGVVESVETAVQARRSAIKTTPYWGCQNVFHSPKHFHSSSRDNNRSSRRYLSEHSHVVHRRRRRGSA